MTRSAPDVHQRPLRVAFVHSFYSSSVPSGENEVVAAEMEALQSAGCTVEAFARHSDELETKPLYPLRSAARVATGLGASPLVEIERFSPDVVHVHNLFPNFGQRWASKLRAPLVHTLHNFRPLCAAATLYRDGKPCRLCPDGAWWSGLRYKCYRGSRAATLPLTISTIRGGTSNSLVRAADLLFAPSDNVRDTYLAAGVPAQKLVVAPHFLPDKAALARRSSHNLRGWVVVGRVSAEKGVPQLVDSWPHGHALTVIGDGAELEETRAAARERRDIDIAGRLSREAVWEHLPDFTGLIIPSRWTEPFCLVYMEALAAGLPVVAFRSSGLGRSVERHGTGLVADWERPIEPLLSLVEAKRHRYSAAARRAFAENFTETKFVDSRLSTYVELIRRRAAK